MRFCTAYEENYHSFSRVGRNWVDATRKCLHQQLVPYLERDDTIRKTTCREIQKFAFESHHCCYMAGKECTREQRPSICEIPCEDWFQVFWTIKAGLVGDTFQESLNAFVVPRIDDLK